MDHNGFERQTRHFPATIKINWTNPAWCVAWRDCANFSFCHITCFGGFYMLEPKLGNVTNYNWKLLKWTEEFFFILMTILSFKMFTWFMENKDWSGFRYFSPDLEKIKQLLVCSKHRNTWEDTGNVVKLFCSIQRKIKNARQYKETEFSKPFVVKAVSLLLNSLKFA